LDFFIRRARAQGVSDALVDEAARRRAAREHIRAARCAPILVKGLVTGRGTAAARVWFAYCRGRAGAVTVR
jgi:hypothetical protein